jgi:hypothetical protein
MSKGYSTALRLAGNTSRPAHINKQVWYRYMAIARDNRLARISNLPDSYTSLYELTRMDDNLLEAVVKAGLIDGKTPARLLKSIRIRKKIPYQAVIWVEPDKWQETVRGLTGQ